MDPFHRNKAIRQWVRHPEQQQEVMRLLYSKKIDDLLEYIEALSNSVDNKDESENLNCLLTYFTNNKDGLIPCHRRGLAMPEPPEGQVYRRMGAMESNVFSLVGNRMKNRRACWSIRGGNNLPRLLCLKNTQRLTGALQDISSAVLPQKYEQKIPNAYVVKSVGKGYNGCHGVSSLPSFPSYKWLKGILSPRPLSDIQI